MAERRGSSNGTLNGDHERRKSQKEEDQESKNDDHDQEEKDEEAPPKPVGFFHSSVKDKRLEVLKGWTLTTLFLMAFILAILSLYWGVLFRVPQNMKSLTVAIVDFDGRVAPYTATTPLVGPAVVSAARMQQAVSTNVVGWVIRDPSEYNYDPIAVRQSVYDQRDWAAVIVNANATALLQEAVSAGNQTYDPLGAAQVVYVQARDETTYANYITPQIDQFQTMVSSTFGEEWVRQVLSNADLNAATYSRAPQAVNPAIGFSTFNLRPFTPETATPAVSIGLIYLIIISFFSFSFYLPIHSKFLQPDGHPPVKFWQMSLWRLIATLVAYLFLSLAYSLVSLAFQIPFSNTFPHNDVTVANNADAYGKGTFPVYWMLNWVGMMALGLASENVTMLIGQPWTALWLVFWVITNVSTAFYAIPLEPGFFKWGYAWPLNNIVTASRTILFDTHSVIGRNFGVLFAWAAINIILYFPCCLVMRYKSNKEQAEQAPRSKLRYLIEG